MNELLKSLTEAVGVSGEEKEIRLLIRDMIADHVDSWHVDGMGNLIALKKGTGESPLRVQVDAHMDEVGLIIDGYDTNGTLKFNAVGGFDPRALLGKVVQVGPKKLTGVIGSRPIHLSTAAQRRSVTQISSMRIDIGAKNKDDAGGKVDIGARAAFVTPYEEQGEIALGKSFDDRAGCAVLVTLLQGEPLPFDLYASFTVQEEVGLRGATVAAYGINPDIALVLECTPAYDLPGEEDASPNVALGKGPGIYVMDSGTFQDPRLVAHISRTAAENGIPYQIRRPGGGGTNTAAIQRTRQAIPAATIGLPGRYLHTPVSMIHLKDFAHMNQLVQKVVQGLTPETVQIDEATSK